MRATTPGGYAEVLKVACPLVISTGSFTVMQFCDRMFLAWHDAVSIQAALPAGILSFTLVCGFMALAGYAGTFVAQHFGAGDHEGCSRSTAQGIWLSVLSWPLLLALIPVGRWLLRLSGHPPAVLEQELQYFTILMAGGVAIPLNAAVSGFFTGRGDTLTNMVVVVLGNLLNVVLDYAMIFGHWGFPEMGIRGAAWATVIAGFVPPAVFLALYLAPAQQAVFRTRRHLGLEPRLLLRMVRFGLPSGLHLVVDLSSFAAFVLVTGHMGEQALAVSNVAFSINMVAFMPLIGIGIAASILVGQHQGRRDAGAAERAGWSAAKIGIAYTAAVGATFLVTPGLYLSLFEGRGATGLSMEELYPLGRWMLVMMAAWGVLDALNVVLAGALKGAGDTRFTMLYSGLMAWLFLVPGQWVLVFVLGEGILVAWAWLTLYIMVLAAGFVVRFRGGRWRTIEVLEPGGAGVSGRPGAEESVVVPD
jgi:MATE family multidrug resistance protein